MSSWWHPGVVWNLLYYCLKGVHRQEACAAAFQRYFIVNIPGGSIYYLNEFPIVSCDLGVVWTLFHCRLKGMYRWEAPLPAFQRYSMLYQPADHFLSHSISHCFLWYWVRFYSILWSFEVPEETQGIRCFTPKISQFYSNSWHFHLSLYKKSLDWKSH